MWSLGRGVLVLGGLLAAAPAAAQSKSLHWRALEVTAELDADGRLNVRERHDMVFTGDWNGGERRFELHKGQALQLRRVSRIDAGGSARDLRERNPPGIDEYFWADAKTLRWRSRAPSDPPFSSTVISYEIEYALSGVLSVRQETYRLDHDFVFPDRPGRIERFVLDFRMNRVWQPSVAVPPRIELRNLPPGTGYRVRSEIRHVGAAPPAAVDHGSPGWRLALLAGLIAGVLLRLAAFRRGEREAGRFAGAVADRDIDAAWLETNVFKLPAEVVGAAWDRSVGSAEVAATLARLESAGQIRTWSEPPSSSVRHLQLLAPHAALTGHERALLDALLVDGGDQTDTSAVKRHYASKGFDPAGVIRPGLEARVRELLGPDRRGRRRWVVTALLFAAAIALLFTGIVTHGDVEALLFAAAALAIALPIGYPFAWRWRWRVDAGFPTAAFFLLPIALAVAGVFFVYWLDPPVGLAAFAGCVAFALALANSLLNRARTTESPDAVALRRRLVAARAFLDRELRRGSPDVRVAWFPHLLALGLAKQADRWSAAQPGRATGTEGWSGSSSSGGSSASAGSGRSEPLTPGGGSFGGAGATGSWAAAAQAFSAGVAAPSTSSGGGSSGGSSGGGSSSGGGGGGGW